MGAWRVYSTRGAAIQISFRDSALERAYRARQEGLRRFGDSSRLFQRRIKQLEAAPNLAAVAGWPTLCQPLPNSDGHLSAQLWDAHRLIFVADHQPLPQLPDGSLDRRRVTRIEIWTVEEDHG